MATAPPSSSQSGWKTIREAILPSLEENPASQNARANWRLVMEALIDDTAPEHEAHSHPPTAAPKSVPAEMSNAQDSPASPVQLATPTQTEVPSTSKAPATPVIVQPVKPAQPLQPVKAVPWGTKEDIDELNLDIESCLEIEGFENPSSFFAEDLSNFPSVAHYYFDLLNKLDEAGIDLFASFQNHLGERHVLVRGIRSIMAEQPRRTYMTRELTGIAEQLDHDGSGIAVPGFRAFSQESRALSWVIRNEGQTVIPRGPPTGPLPSIQGSIDVRSPIPGEPKRDQIVCPGLPVSFDTYSQPQPPPQMIMQQPQPSAQKKTVFGRFMSCFCFAG